MRLVYKTDGAGRVIRVPVSHKHRRRIDYDEGESFEKRMVRAYYEKECEMGAQFKPNHGHHTAREIKEAWAK